MMIKLNDFLSKLEKASYFKYTIYNRKENLFISLYNSEDVENYMIVEPVTPHEHPPIISALELHKK